MKIETGLTKKVGPVFILQKATNLANLRVYNKKADTSKQRVRVGPTGYPTLLLVLCRKIC